jgi:hypothetical protein
MKKNILLTLPLFLFGLSSFIQPRNRESSTFFNQQVSNAVNKFQNLTDGVLVGHRTGENTAQLVISKSGIQQNIVASLPELTGISVTDDPITIHINEITSYLLFQATDTSGKKMTIAIELVSSSNDLLFQDKSGREIHTCKSMGNCNSCGFSFYENRIFGCSCNSMNGSDSTVISNCDHIGSILN